MTTEENKGLTRGTDKKETEVVKPKSAIAKQWEGFRTFLFNKDEKSVLGRNALSWAKIGLFYLVYYSLLAGFFAGWLQIFFLTVDSQYPKQFGMTSLLKNNPGMGFRPQPDVESTLIHVIVDDPSSYKAYVDNLKGFMTKYENKSSEQTCEFKDDGMDRNNSKSCRFNAAEMGNACTKENNYGYADGQPCVLLKMNRIYGFVPQPYTDAADLPQEAKDRGIEDGPNWSDHSIGITCEGQNPGDQQNMGKVDFYPKSGFDLKFYPYLNQDGYLQPIVMAKFSNVKPGVLVMIWCKVWAKDIYHHKNDRAGSVMFEMIVDRDMDSMHSSKTTPDPTIKYNASSNTR